MPKVPCPDCGVLVIIDRVMPDGWTCARCQQANARAYPDPATPYRLNEHDRRLLRTIKIAQDE